MREINQELSIKELIVCDEKKKQRELEKNFHRFK